MKYLSIISLISFMLCGEGLHAALCAWDNLDSNMKIKIMACVNVDSRRGLQCVNRELSTITTEHLMHHSPLFLTRRDHMWCMIQAAKAHNTALLINLINNAHFCDHEDVVDWIPIFYRLHARSLLVKFDTQLSKGQRFCVNGRRGKKCITFCRNTYRLFAQNNIPFVISFYKGDNDIMDEYMCRVGNIKDKNEIIRLKQNPLLVSVHAGHKSMVELLLIRNPEMIHEEDVNGNGPLFFAYSTDIKRLLLACKDIKIDMTVFDAILNNDVDILRALLNKREWSVGIDKSNHTLLHTAVLYANEEIVEIILKYFPVLLNMRDRLGYTPLMYAAEYGYTKLVDVLLAYGANDRLTNQQGRNARQLAGNLDILDRLVTYRLNNTSSMYSMC